MDIKSIGRRIKQLRKDANLNQDRFGELCEVTKGAVSSWENGTYLPELEKLLQIRKVIPFSLDYILAGDNQDQPIAKEPSVLSYVHEDPIVRQVIALMEKTDAAGRGMIFMAACQAIDKYRPIKETAA
jgi:transcriptional regulator with XRE-family HTH domain